LVIKETNRNHYGVDCLVNKEQSTNPHSITV